MPQRKDDWGQRVLGSGDSTEVRNLEEQQLGPAPHQPARKRPEDFRLTVTTDFSAAGLAHQLGGNSLRVGERRELCPMPPR